MKIGQYQIEPKKDFGKRGVLINGKFVTSGFVVTDAIRCNVMPGATWFQTIGEALRGIAALEASAGDASVFWENMRAGK